MQRKQRSQVFESRIAIHSSLSRHRLAQRLRRVNRNLDERLRSAGRFAPTMLPLLQGGDSYAE